VRTRTRASTGAGVGHPPLRGDHHLDKDTFWRVHRSFLVNIHKIKEVVPWFKSSYQLRMDDKKHTEVPVSRVQTKRLRELLKL
jgi:two-component system LytT family response regulator/two-component system response regulator LytT